MFHLSHVQQMFRQPTDLTHKLILCVHITRAREDFNGDSTEKTLLAPSFEPVTFRPRYSSIKIFQFFPGQAKPAEMLRVRDRSKRKLLVSFRVSGVTVAFRGGVARDGHVGRDPRRRRFEEQEAKRSSVSPVRKARSSRFPDLPLSAELQVGRGPVAAPRVPDGVGATSGQGLRLPGPRVRQPESRGGRRR